MKQESPEPLGMACFRMFTKLPAGTVAVHLFVSFCFDFLEFGSEEGAMELQRLFRQRKVAPCEASAGAGFTQ